LGTLLAKYGPARLEKLVEALLDYSELRMRQELRKLPPGTYHGEYLIDDDGIDADRRFRVQVALAIESEGLRVDFTGTDAQARGPINASYAQATSGVLFAVRAFLDPRIPMNDGCYRPLRLILPEGSLVNPRPPAACNARQVTNMAVAEAMIRALYQAAPDKSLAASSVNHVYTLSGRDTAGGYWLFLENEFGGMGARSELDGVDGAGSLLMAGSFGSTSVEALETEYPVRFREFRLWPDSGGPGARRGGLGLQRTVEVLEAGEVTVRTDRCRFPPPGLAGGRPGASGGWMVNADGPTETRLPSKKTSHPLRPGETLTMRTSGGGGYGDAFRRDPERVAEDVRTGRVSIGGAARDYGVVIDPSTGEVDVVATSRLRRNPPERPV
jgi:N-methylhydantoinase B